MSMVTAGRDHVFTDVEVINAKGIALWVLYAPVAVYQHRSGACIVWCTVRWPVRLRTGRASMHGDGGG